MVAAWGERRAADIRTEGWQSDERSEVNLTFSTQSELSTLYDEVSLARRFQALLHCFPFRQFIFLWNSAHLSSNPFQWQGLYMHLILFLIVNKYCRFPLMCKGSFFLSFFLSPSLPSLSCHCNLNLFFFCIPSVLFSINFYHIISLIHFLLLKSFLFLSCRLSLSLAVGLVVVCFTPAELCGRSIEAGAPRGRSGCVRLSERLPLWPHRFLRSGLLSLPLRSLCLSVSVSLSAEEADTLAQGSDVSQGLPFVTLQPCSADGARILLIQSYYVRIAFIVFMEKCKQAEELVTFMF